MYHVSCIIVKITCKKSLLHVDLLITYTVHVSLRFTHYTLDITHENENQYPIYVCDEHELMKNNDIMNDVNVNRVHVRCKM